MAVLPERSESMSSFKNNNKSELIQNRKSKIDLKLLHLTHHAGCAEDIKQVCATLGYELHTEFANCNYNMDASLARQMWEADNRPKDFYNSFDCIITSDTAPLSRIFLQNGYTGKLIIWVCNRFDYADEATNNHGFPDKAYIDMFKEAATAWQHPQASPEGPITNNQQPITKVFSYTKFEHEYALKKYGFQWDPENIIRPCCQVNVNPFVRSDKAGFFFIGSYHNDNIFMDLQAKCHELEITTYHGRYNGIQDLMYINGIIHIPYAWSNLALFENWAIGNVYFIPSKEFLLELSSKSNFFWSPPFHKEFIESSEWYLPEHKELFLYFDSWAHLQWLTREQGLINDKKKLVKEFAVKHQQKTLDQWRNAIEIW